MFLLLCHRQPLMSSTLLRGITLTCCRFNIAARKSTETKNRSGGKKKKDIVREWTECWTPVSSYCVIKGDIHTTWQPFSPLNLWTLEWATLLRSGNIIPSLWRLKAHLSVILKKGGCCPNMATHSSSFSKTYLNGGDVAWAFSTLHV